eukprot:scaffold6077_cov231-Ochromonas_danica.AAC.1
MAQWLPFNPEIYGNMVQMLLDLDEGFVLNPPGNTWTPLRKSVLRDALSNIDTLTALHLDASDRSDRIINMVIAAFTFSVAEKAETFSEDNLFERGWLIFGQGGFQRIVQLETNVTNLTNNVTNLTTDMIQVKAGIQELLQRLG